MQVRTLPGQGAAQFFCNGVLHVVTNVEALCKPFPEVQWTGVGYECCVGDVGDGVRERREDGLAESIGLFNLCQWCKKGNFPQVWFKNA